MVGAVIVFYFFFFDNCQFTESQRGMEYRCRYEGESVAVVSRMMMMIVLYRDLLSQQHHHGLPSSHLQSSLRRAESRYHLVVAAQKRTLPRIPICLQFLSLGRAVQNFTFKNDILYTALPRERNCKQIGSWVKSFSALQSLFRSICGSIISMGTLVLAVCGYRY